VYSLQSVPASWPQDNEAGNASSPSAPDKIHPRQFSFFTPASSVYFGKLKAKKVAGPKTNAIAEPWSLSLPLAAPLLLLLPPRTQREN